MCGDRSIKEDTSSLPKGCQKAFGDWREGSGHCQGALCMGGAVHRLVSARDLPCSSGPDNINDRDVFLPSWGPWRKPRCWEQVPLAPYLLAAAEAMENAKHNQERARLCNLAPQTQSRGLDTQNCTLPIGKLLKSCSSS